MEATANKQTRVPMDTGGTDSPSAAALTTLVAAAKGDSIWMDLVPSLLDQVQMSHLFEDSKHFVQAADLKHMVDGSKCLGSVMSGPAPTFLDCVHKQEYKVYRRLCDMWNVLISMVPEKQQQKQPVVMHDNGSACCSDMPLLSSVEDLVSDWEQLRKESPHRGFVEKPKLRDFLKKHFAEPGSDVLNALPDNWLPDMPSFLVQVRNAESKEFAMRVNSLWRILFKKTSPSVLKRPQNHSLLPLPHPFVIPGDRFRECYNWDSYWILCGLVACGHIEMARQLTTNLLHLVDILGFIPNGVRAYYKNRSQPPLISAMVRAVHKAAPDLEFLEHALPRLVATHKYWMSGNKRVEVMGPDGQVHVLSRYHAEFYKPRPESYREDQGTSGKLLGRRPRDSCSCQYMEAAQPVKPKGEAALAKLPGTARVTRCYSIWEDQGLAHKLGVEGAAAAQLYCDIATAAESGWDFSSRWFADGFSFATICTTKVVPADLNGYLYMLESDIADFAKLVGQTELADEFQQHASRRKAAMAALMWSETHGCWFDLMLQPAPAIAQPDCTSAAVTADSDNTVQQACPAATAISDITSLLSGTGQAQGQVTSMQTAGLGPSSTAESQFLQFSAHQIHRMYASNFVPLWCGLCTGDQAQALSVVAGLKASNLVRQAGVLTSLYETGEQWDYPNAWAPLQHTIIDALVQVSQMYPRPSPTKATVTLEHEPAGAAVHAALQNAVANETSTLHADFDLPHPPSFTDLASLTAPAAGGQSVDTAAGTSTGPNQAHDQIDFATAATENLDDGGPDTMNEIMQVLDIFAHRPHKEQQHMAPISETQPVESPRAAFPSVVQGMTHPSPQLSPLRAPGRAAAAVPALAVGETVSSPFASEPLAGSPLSPVRRGFSTFVVPGRVHSGSLPLATLSSGSFSRHLQTPNMSQAASESGGSGLPSGLPTPQLSPGPTDISAQMADLVFSGLSSPTPGLPDIPPPSPRHLHSLVGSPAMLHRAVTLPVPTAVSSQGLYSPPEVLSPITSPQHVFNIHVDARPHGGAPPQPIAVDMALEALTSPAPSVAELVPITKVSAQDASQLAVELALAWIRCNQEAYVRTGAMHEKYNALTGFPGGGGEYTPQVGFGWTNGVVLDLMRMYAGFL